MHPLLSQLRDDTVRDLAWLLTAPELLQKSYAQLPIRLTSRREAWLRQLDRQPQPLHEQIGKQKRLGQYYEALWCYFYQQDAQFDLVAHNLQVQVNGRTAGEFDFILYDHLQQRFIHQEVAIKFYLYYSPCGAAENAGSWLGPNSRDTLQKKCTHLLNKQSRLSLQPEAKAVLAEKGIDLITPCISLKGYLFNPAGSVPQGFNRENRINPWYFLHEAEAQLTAGNFIALHKPHWINAIHHSKSQHIINKQNVLDEMQTAGTPRLFARIKQQKDLLVETERFFIAPACWPAITAA